ncbi:hypothetical protein GGX14DRAFT_652710 [Mycena pura]|uniref:Nephrocystin 3-like N-terminal domain-containing protein n=1 Tax=Mycena pura TaxID=153505 RepID=A0AAD6Y794_9AGAR|nr:hypothetical protein GGX14DRAFT_652710 [Mycena pura]
MSGFGETLGLVTGIIQLVDTALKAREYVKDFYGAPAEQRKLFTEMQDLKPMFEELKRRLDTHASSGSTSVLQHMQEPLSRVDKFKATMEKFTAKFRVPGSPLAQLSKQLSWTLWNKNEAKEYLNEFEHIKSLLNFWLAMEKGTAETHRRSRDADQEHKKAHHAILTAIVNNNDETKRTEILDWITPLNFFQRQGDIFRTWEQGTGEWLLSHPDFKNWESGSTKVLWCRGIPGAGKTVLSYVFHLLKCTKGLSWTQVPGGTSPPQQVLKW